LHGTGVVAGIDSRHTVADVAPPAHARRGIPDRGEHRQVAKLPQQILKDIPRPPNSASRAD